MICGSERLHTLSVSLLEISRKDKPVGELCTHGIVPANDCNWPPNFLSESPIQIQNKDRMERNQ